MFTKTPISMILVTIIASFALIACDNGGPGSKNAFQDNDATMEFSSDETSDLSSDQTADTFDVADEQEVINVSQEVANDAFNSAKQAVEEAQLSLSNAANLETETISQVATDSSINNLEATVVGLTEDLKQQVNKLAEAVDQQASEAINTLKDEPVNNTTNEN